MLDGLRGLSAKLKNRPSILGQNLPPRGTGLITGTARTKRGLGRPLTDIERAPRHRAIYGQSCIEEGVGGGKLVKCLVAKVQNRKKLF